MSTAQRVINLAKGRLSYGIDGKGPVILFLHGLGGGLKSWEMQFEMLKDEFTVLAWNAPGYGESDRRGADVDIYAEAAAELLKALDYSDITLVGHSMGGLIAGCLTTRYPKLISRLILSSTFAGVGNPTRGALDEGYKNRLKELYSMTPLEFGRARARSMTSEHVDPNVFNRIVEISSEVDRNGGYEDGCKMLNCTDNRECLSELKLPVLILEGEEDSIVSRSEGDLLASLIPNAERKLIQDAGHASYFEEPEKYNQFLKNFILGN